MKPKYIPLFLVLLASTTAGVYWLLYPEMPRNLVDAPATPAESYNFLTTKFSPVAAGITTEDIEAYEAAKADVTDEERAAFYADAATAYQSLTYHEALDGQVAESESATTTDLDLIVDLIMADINFITDNQVVAQTYRAPIQSEAVLPDYVISLDTHYPTRYLTEVMVRDTLLRQLYPDYAPDREAYFQDGIAMGLYYESDVVNAQELITSYFTQAREHNNFVDLMSHLATPTFTVPAGLDMTEEAFRAALEASTETEGVADGAKEPLVIFDATNEVDVNQ